MDGSSLPSSQDPTSGQSVVAPTNNKGKKRKEMQPRSKRWIGYTRFNCEKTGIVMARCNRCKRELQAPSSSGTNVLDNHTKSCLKQHGRSSSQTTIVGAHHSGEKTVSIHKYDAEEIRQGLVKMIIMDELPFKFVEGLGFKIFMFAVCPQFSIPSRWTIQRDCVQLFVDEKVKLKEYFIKNSQRVCLTTDTWTSLQKVNYMCVTAHYIDDNWRLNKRLLSFLPIASHKGKEIGMAIEKVLLDWGITKLFTVTVDNASSNDTAIEYLKNNWKNYPDSIMGCVFMHMRCVAHILNLVVTDGLSSKEVTGSIRKVREAIKFVKSSPSRLARFKDGAKIEKIDSKGWLSLDVCTRWNSTYLMLDTAEKFEKVFKRFEEEDRYFCADLEGTCEGVPTSKDWQNVRRMVTILKHFYDLTQSISGSLYVTANTFFHEIVALHDIFKKWQESEDVELSILASKMSPKVDKYWGKPGKMNKLIYIAVILDPREKLDYLEYTLVDMYGPDQGGELFRSIRDALYALYNDYVVRIMPQEGESSQVDGIGGKRGGGDIGRSNNLSFSYALKKERKNRFKQLRQEGGFGEGSKSELDKYLAENPESDNEEGGNENKFDILSW